QQLVNHLQCSPSQLITLPARAISRLDQDWSDLRLAGKPCERRDLSQTLESPATQAKRCQPFIIRAVRQIRTQLVLVAEGIPGHLVDALQQAASEVEPRRASRVARLCQRTRAQENGRVLHRHLRVLQALLILSLISQFVLD